MSDFTWAAVVQRWFEVFAIKASWLGAGVVVRALGVLRPVLPQHVPTAMERRAG